MQVWVLIPVAGVGVESGATRRVHCGMGGRASPASDTPHPSSHAPLSFLMSDSPTVRYVDGSHLLGFARVAGDEELEVLAQDYLHRMACHHASSLLITYVPLAWLQARSLRTGAKVEKREGEKKAAEI